MLSLIEVADKAALVEFADKRRIDEIRGLGVLTAFAQGVDDELDTFERWILIARKFIVSNRHVVTSFRDLWVSVAPASEMFGEHLETGLAIRLHDVHGFDLRFDIATDNVRLLAYEFSRGDNPIVLKRQVAHIGQDMKALPLRQENRVTSRGLPSELQVAALKRI
jgi:hypothetical protein